MALTPEEKSGLAIVAMLAIVALFAGAVIGAALWTVSVLDSDGKAHTPSEWQQKRR